ncbi:MAG TPA: hypothetical protein VM327_08295 [Candidatus Thermoplasmatota archaeon]|nr:hypothetical protein [Candidatus Thermoplasmatota archaeon]
MAPPEPPQEPLPGFLLGPQTWGRILPDLPRRPPWQARLPILEIPGPGTKASAHRTLHGDPCLTTGVAAIDVGFAAAQKYHRFRDVAVARAGPDLLPREVDLFWTLHGYDLPERVWMPTPWRGVPALIHMGSEAQLLPRFLRALEASSSSPTTSESTNAPWQPGSAA